jgi:GntR family transcriptional regulator
MDKPPIEFRLSSKSGVSPYLQLVHQVRHAIRLGMLRPGDRLPTLKQVVASLAINPNTVLKAYRELEHEGLVAGRPGQGTFVLQTNWGPPSPALGTLRRTLDRWLDDAFAAGLDVDSVAALFETSLGEAQARGAA